MSVSNLLLNSFIGYVNTNHTKEQIDRVIFLLTEMAVKYDLLADQKMLLKELVVSN